MKEVGGFVYWVEQFAGFGQTVLIAPEPVFILM
jgi:hypothetical protein